jgi:hypothetical protein
VVVVGVAKAVVLFKLDLDWKLGLVPALTPVVYLETSASGGSVVEVDLDWQFGDEDWPYDVGGDDVQLLVVAEPHVGERFFERFGVFLGRHGAVGVDDFDFGVFELSACADDGPREFAADL